MSFIDHDAKYRNKNNHLEGTVVNARSMATKQLSITIKYSTYKGIPVTIRLKPNNVVNEGRFPLTVTVFLFSFPFYKQRSICLIDLDCATFCLARDCNKSTICKSDQNICKKYLYFPVRFNKKCVWINERMFNIITKSKG